MIRSRRFAFIVACLLIALLVVWHGASDGDDDDDSSGGDTELDFDEGRRRATQRANALMTRAQRRALAGVCGAYAQSPWPPSAALRAHLLRELDGDACVPLPERFRVPFVLWDAEQARVLFDAADASAGATACATDDALLPVDAARALRRQPPLDAPRRLASQKNFADVWLWHALAHHAWRVRARSRRDALAVVANRSVVHVLPLLLTANERAGASGACTPARRVDALLDALAARAAAFDVYGGANFVAFATGTTNDRLLSDAARRVLRGVHVASQQAQWYRLALPCLARVVTLPYPVGSHVQATTLGGDDGASALPSMRARRLSLFFQGALTRQDTLGVRAALRALDTAADKRAGIYVHGVDADAGNETERFAYARRLRDARLCLVPRGDSPASLRFFEAIASGCVPVLVADDVALPFAWLIPYDSFVLRASEAALIADARGLAQRLVQRTSLDALAVRQRRMLRYRSALLYALRGWLPGLARRDNVDNDDNENDEDSKPPTFGRVHELLLIEAQAKFDFIQRTSFRLGAA